MFEEGEPGKAIFIVRTGRIELTRRVGEGQRTLSLLGAGQMFGEMAILDNVKRTASATVKEEGNDLAPIYSDVGRTDRPPPARRA